MVNLMAPTRARTHLITRIIVIGICPRSGSSQLVSVCFYATFLRGCPYARTVFIDLFYLFYFKSVAWLWKFSSTITRAGNGYQFFCLGLHYARQDSRSAYLGLFVV